ncbi:MAG TPA: glycosyltransferase family 39 protein [Candidatus Acidoferrum sp.]|nr:glycosyltransferase family 39 protein [Candidatus Acidoferrum sp.]
MRPPQFEAENPVLETHGNPSRITYALYHTPVVALLLLLGTGLRAWAYFRDTSLYLDEILLSRNILDLPLAQLLFKPLALDQVAPRGFLLIEHLSVTIFGPSEYALRLLPFVCGIASLALFWRLAERILAPTGSALALFLFAIGVPFIRFGAEVKQYECDLLAGILLLLLVLRLLEGEASNRRLAATGLVGFFVIWFSQASVLVMGGLGAVLALQWIVSRDRKTGRILLFTISLWAVASVIAVVVGNRSMTPSTRQYMNDFWTGAFFPLPFHFSAGVNWIGQRFLELFSEATLLRYRWPIVFALLAAAGIAVVWKRSRVAAWLLCGPAVLALAAAIAHQYPFRGRLSFWLLPAALLALAAGTDWIRAKVSALHPAVGMLVVLAVSIAPVMALAQAPPPYEIEHHWETLSYLQQHRQPGDVIYVMQVGEVGVRFYGPRFGLQPNEWITGACDGDDSRVFLRDLDRFRGTPRLWVLAGTGRHLVGVRAATRKYLGTIGIRRDAKAFPSMLYGSITVELYDLTDPARLATASADNFPVPAMPRDPKIGCRDWVKPEFDWNLAKP